MSPIEWSGLLLLLLLLLGLIAVLPGGTVLGALVAGMLAGTWVTLMVLLRKLDLLRWHERARSGSPPRGSSGTWDTTPTFPARSSRAAATGRAAPSGSLTTPIPIRYGSRRL